MKLACLRRRCSLLSTVSRLALFALEVGERWHQCRSRSGFGSGGEWGNVDDGGGGGKWGDKVSGGEAVGGGDGAGGVVRLLKVVGGGAGGVAQEVPHWVRRRGAPREARLAITTFACRRMQLIFISTICHRVLLTYYTN
eukprot:4236849-Pleurochrysis_carterae.AAC.6